MVTASLKFLGDTGSQQTSCFSFAYELSIPFFYYKREQSIDMLTWNPVPTLTLFKNSKQFKRVESGIIYSKE